MTPTRRPGYSGRSIDSCVVCDTGTDTRLAFRGEPAWLIEVISALGVRPLLADTMVRDASDHPGGRVREGVVQLSVRICERCAALASLPRPTLAVPGEVVYVCQPSSGEIDP